MTKAAQAFGKRLDHFWDNKDTQAYCEALSNAVHGQVPPNSGEARNSLIERGHTNAIYGGGTWGHPKLAVFFARWLDVRFAVWCDQVIDTIIHDGGYLKGEEKMTDDQIMAKGVAL